MRTPRVASSAAKKPRLLLASAAAGRRGGVAPIGPSVSIAAVELVAAGEVVAAAAAAQRRRRPTASATRRPRRLTRLAADLLGGPGAGEHAAVARRAAAPARPERRPAAIDRDVAGAGGQDRDGARSLMNVRSSSTRRAGEGVAVARVDRGGVVGAGRRPIEPRRRTGTLALGARARPARPRRRRGARPRASQPGGGGVRSSIAGGAADHARCAAIADARGRRQRRGRQRRPIKAPPRRRRSAGSGRIAPPRSRGG